MSKRGLIFVWRVSVDICSVLPCSTPVVRSAHEQKQTTYIELKPMQSSIFRLIFALFLVSSVNISILFYHLINHSPIISRN